MSTSNTLPFVPMPVGSVALDRPKRITRIPRRLVMNMSDAMEHYATELVTESHAAELDELLGDETDTMYATTDTEADERPNAADDAFVEGGCDDMYLNDREFTPDEESIDSDSSSESDCSYMSDEDDGDYTGDDEGDYTGDDEGDDDECVSDWHEHLQSERLDGRPAPLVMISSATSEIP